MKLLSIRLPNSLVNHLDKLVEDGVITSRGEGIRLAIRDYYLRNYIIIKKKS